MRPERGGGASGAGVGAVLAVIRGLVVSAGGKRGLKESPKGSFFSPS